MPSSSRSPRTSRRLPGAVPRRCSPRGVSLRPVALIVAVLCLSAGLARATEEEHLTRDEAIVRALPGVVRLEAARFSFLLSIPTIAGAAILTIADLMSEPEPARWLDLSIGAGLAALSAYLCISAFISLVERTGMLPYVIYRLLLGAGLFYLAT